MKSIASALCVSGLAASSYAAGVPTLTNIGIGTANSISADGSIVTGVHRGGMWTWSASGGLEAVPAVGAYDSCISSDGSVLAGVTADSQNNTRMCYRSFPALGGEWQFLPTIYNADCTDAYLSFDVFPNANGTVFGGSVPNAGCFGLNVAITWSGAEGLTEWYSPYGTHTRVTGISADGRTIMGGHYTEIEGVFSHHGCIWYADGTFEPVSMERFHGELTAMNRDGTIFAGNTHPETGDAYTWSAAGGFQSLGPIVGIDFVLNKTPLAMTDDGLIVVGSAGDMWSSQPVIWTPGEGGRALKDYLQGLGVSGIEDYYFMKGAKITPDGRFIIGQYMLDDGLYEPHAFVIDLEGQGSLCPADFNQDGGVDGGDVEAFFAAWENAGANADVNQDGGIDGGDVETFFAAWEAGGCD